MYAHYRFIPMYWLYHTCYFAGIHAEADSQRFCLTKKKKEVRCEWTLLTVCVLVSVLNAYKTTHSLHSSFL